jgi:hypothetical protein
VIVVWLVVRSDEVSISAEANTPAYESRNINSRDDVMVGNEEDEDEKGLIVAFEIQCWMVFSQFREPRTKRQFAQAVVPI